VWTKIVFPGPGLDTDLVANSVWLSRLQQGEAHPGTGVMRDPHSHGDRVTEVDRMSMKSHKRVTSTPLRLTEKIHERQGVFYFPASEL